MTFWPRARLTLIEFFSRASKASLPLDDIPSYPPPKAGLPLVDVHQLLRKHQDQLLSIRTTLGLEPEFYQTQIEPVFLRYARFVHLLPASENHHHRAAGGLLHHGLEVAFLATQATEHDVPYASPLLDLTPTERRDRHRCWRVAVCLAALVHDLAKPVTDVQVQDESGNDVWPPFTESLYDWALTRRLERYYVHWTPHRHAQHEHLNGLLVARILGSDLLTYINRFEPRLIVQLISAISAPSADHPIARYVQPADQRSTQRDLATHHVNPLMLTGAMPIERSLVDAMRQLLACDAWSINVNGARLWVFKEGVFIVWKQAAAEICALLRKQHIAGIPQAPSTLAEILCEKGIAVPWVDETGEHALWRVAPDRLQNPNSVTLSMLRLAHAQTLFEHGIPAPTTGVIAGQRSGGPVEVDEPIPVIDGDTGVAFTDWEPDRAEVSSDRPNGSEPPTDEAQPIETAATQIDRPIIDALCTVLSASDLYPDPLLPQNLLEPLIQVDGRYYVPYLTLGEHKLALLNQLKARSWLVPLDDNPQVYVHPVGKTRALRFSEPLQEALSQLAKTPVPTPPVKPSQPRAPVALPKDETHSDDPRTRFNSALAELCAQTSAPSLTLSWPDWVAYFLERGVDRLYIRRCTEDSDHLRIEGDQVTVAITHAV